MRTICNLCLTLTVFCMPLTLEAQHATTLEIVSSTTQGRPAGSLVPAPPVVRVRDQSNNPMPGVDVTFAVTTGDGSITPSSVATGSDGTARVTSWQLGNTPGWNTMTASVRHLPSLTFKIYGARIPTTIASVSPRSITGSPGAVVTELPAVIIRDQFGLPMQGEVVKFAIWAGNEVTSLVVDTTGADGIARLSSWTLSQTAGTNVVNARSLGLPDVRFVATTVQLNPATIVPVLGAGSTYGWFAGRALTYVPAMTVVVRDQNGNPLPGVSVSFAVASGGGLLSPASVMTGSDGSAHPVSWTLGSTPGLNTATATVVGLSSAMLNVVGNLTASTVQAATALTQNALASSGATILPGVLVKDQFGNPMSAVPVTFAITSGDGSVSPVTPVMTGANGIARATSWMVGTKGPSVVRATVVRLPAVSFTAQVTEPFTLVAYVKGPDGNAIPSATICVGSGRELAAFGVKSADTNGRAIFTVPIASQYAVTASNPGYAGQTVPLSPSGSSGTITLRLASGLIGATCSPTR